MAFIHLHILASGSKGNACIVEGPQGMVLIDCGISKRELTRRAEELNINLGQIKALLLTHEHSDHVSGVSVFAKSFTGPLFATAGTVAARTYLTQLPFTLIGHVDEFELVGMNVRVFPTSHDVADPVGFCFSTEDDKVGYCTDTGMVTEEAYAALTGARTIALESNHDTHMLKTGPYPRILKERVASEKGHLSNEQAADALKVLVTSNTQTVIAMHLSQENNRPSVAVRTLAEALNAKQANTTFTEARTSDGYLSICAAGQDRPLSIW